jgi:hypothetical protein
MITRTAKDVIGEYPTYALEWGFKTPIIESCGHGSIEQVVVCNNEGKPLYDKYRINNEPGVIVVPYDMIGGIRVGLIEEERVIPGRIFTGVIRGYREIGETLYESVLRELHEEGGFVPEEIIKLNLSNPNTADYKNSDTVFAARVENLEKGSRILTDGFAENILSVKPFYFSQLKQDKLECSVTKSALFDFGCFMPDFYKY